MPRISNHSCDEPVASLDPLTTKQVMDDLKKINEELGITILINLHFVDLAKEYGSRIIGLRAGELVYDGPASEAWMTMYSIIFMVGQLTKMKS